VATTLPLIGLAIGSGVWLEKQRAERREEMARQEGRESQALEAGLKQVADFQKRGHWPEARGLLEGAPSLLTATTSAELRERVRQARADADIVAELEEVRLRLSGGRESQEAASLSPEKMYADAFRKYGISLTSLGPAEAAARIRRSAIRETLLAFLHDWFYWVSDENRPRLRDVLDRADDDDWRRAYREALVEKDADKLNALAHAPEAPTQPPVILSGLGGAMLADKYKNEALALLREAQQRHPSDFWINYLLGQFWLGESPHQAIGYFRAAVAIRPTSDQAYAMLAQALRDSEDGDGAVAAFRQSLALNPSFAVAKDLVTTLVQRGRLDDARAAWDELLERDPPDHEFWYGYAELCLFLGQQDQYRRAQRALLERFGATTNPFDAERTARACLLSPITGDELHQAVTLAKRAVAQRSGDEWGHPYFQFLHGLVEYRLGQFDRAIATMRGDASRVLGPAPRLVLAMAQHRSGRVAGAREVLAAAVQAHDWRANLARDQAGWMYHVLRREAESIILPSLPAFLDGKYQPRDNDERLALLGACQFTNRTRAIARLYACTFAAAPAMLDDLAAGHRYNAARSAALAGCGQGADAIGLGEGEGKQWRDQARQWLQADLAARARALGDGPMAARGVARTALNRWRMDPDLACVRDLRELDKLTPDERKEYLALWAEVDAILARTEK
jgi:serine/threonine-protein kinase